jgi:hypothetical protein
MPLGAARLTLLAATTTVEAVAEVIRKKKGVSAIGDAQIDTDQSYFGGSSALFDESGDYLTIESEDFKFGTGDFTIECWVRASKTPANEGIFQLSSTGLRSANTDTLAVAANAGGSSTYWQMYAADGQQSTQAPLQPASATWYHVAMVRTSGNTKLYVNGAEQQTKADTKDYSMTDTLVIGGYYSTSFLWPGHIDEFRISTIARYTGSFNPTPVPFKNDNDTLLLLHMDGTDGSTVFIDDNGNHGTTRTAVAVDAGNDATSDTSQYKFGDASLYLDGTDDYLEVGGATFLDDFVNTAPWTIEYWIRPQSTSGFETHFGNWGGSSTRCFFLGSDNGTQLTFYWVDSGGTIDTTTIGKNSGALTVNSWNHVALTNDGTNFNLYSNGTRVATGANDTIRAQAERTRIGASANDAEDFLGHIDEFRISTVERYSGTSYTQPTTRFINDSDTLLLLHFDGDKGTTTFTDDNTEGRSPIGMFASGNAQLDTAQSYFGGSSYLGDGTDDRIVSGNSDTFTFYGDFTWECYIRAQDLGNTNTTHILTNRGGFVGNAALHLLWRGLDEKLQWGTQSSGALLNNSALSYNTWYHLAIVRHNGVIKLYVDGTAQTTTYTTSDTVGSGNNNKITIGGLDNGSGTEFNGHIDEVRVSNTARYTTNFNRPTTPFANDTNTVVLLHMDGTDGDSDFIDDNGKISGVGGLETGAYYANPGSDFSNISSDTSSWTVSWWHKASDKQSTDGWALYLRDGATNEFMARVETNGDIEVLADGNNFAVNSNYADLNATTGDNEWHHIAADCNGSTVKLYVDGVDTGYSGTVRTARLQSITGMGVGGLYTDGTQSDNGKAQIALWLTSQDLATNISKLYNRGPVDLGSDGTASGLSQPELLFEGTDFSTNKGTDNINWNSQTLSNTNIAPAHLPLPGGRVRIGVRAEGSGAVDTAQYKFGGASFVADGTGDDNLAIDENAFDWTKINNHSQTDNYTLECWIRSTNVATTNAIFGTRTSTASHNWDLEIRTNNGNGTLRWFNGNSELYYSAGGVVSADTWHHIAVVVEGADLTVYVDGTSVITQTRTDSNTTGGSDFFIGKGGFPTLNKFYGNIDEFRLSDTARYTSNFTAPTEPFQNDGNTLLLIHMNGTDGSTTFLDDNGYYE